MCYSDIKMLAELLTSEQWFIVHSVCFGTAETCCLALPLPECVAKGQTECVLCEPTTQLVAMSNLVSHAG